MVGRRQSSDAESAFEQLYRRYGGLVLRRARRLLSDEQGARDVCQDVFMQMLQSGREVPPACEVAWLYRVTTNCCLNVIRRARRWRRVAQAIGRADVVDPGLSLPMFLRGVPKHLHEVAIYYGLDGMSQDEIGMVLGLSQKTISNRLRELRAVLGDDDQRTREQGR
jgi:RNA polymerase sigma-70 factor (ECF subfamily)